jgi:hypothetical protein
MYEMKHKTPIDWYIPVALANCCLILTGPWKLSPDCSSCSSGCSKLLCAQNNLVYNDSKGFNGRDPTSRINQLIRVMSEIQKNLLLNLCK